MDHIINRYLNKLVSVMLVAVLLSLTCCAVFAESVVQCTLNIEYVHEATPVSGAQFRLYRIADMDKKLNLTYVGVFADLELDADGLVEAVEDLHTRVVNTGAAAEISLTTDELGQASVSNVASGAFLLVAEPTTIGSSVYHVDKQIVFLPNRWAEGSEPETELTLHPKSTKLPTGTELIKVKVVKIWDDKAYEDQRPRNITVRLLRDGKTVSTVTLSESNQWSHTWTNLMPNARWTVEENVPKGYVVTVQENDHVFSLINHRKDIEQTGQIWWPVITVLCVGLALIVIGVSMRRSGRYEA